jgi:hypothetical protein
MFPLDMVLIWLTGDFASNERLVAVPTGLEPVTFGLGSPAQSLNLLAF